MRAKPRDWTEQEVSELLLMRKMGISKNEIAKIFNRNIGSVCSKLERLAGLRKNNGFSRKQGKDGGNISRVHIEFMRSLIPPDTRNWQQTFLGDPPIWRSALGRAYGGEYNENI